MVNFSYQLDEMRDTQIRSKALPLDMCIRVFHSTGVGTSQSARDSEKKKGKGKEIAFFIYSGVVSSILFYT
jgi:hypothetical protein